MISQDKQLIKELLIEMNNLLSEHIEIHDAIFNPPLRAKIPIPFIMKKIDFEEQYNKAQNIIIALEECLKRAIVMKDYGKMNNSTYQTIYEYGQCFLDSVGSLTTLAYESYLKAERKNKLNFKEFNAMIDEYEDNERVRLNHADKLNQLAKEYFQ